MTGEHVLDVTQHLLSLSANDYTRSSTTACTRTFLRFLQWSGLNDQDLARFVPRTPCYRLAHVPPRLAWEDVRRVIDAIDVTAPSGIRDRALLLLLATTGLRNKELRSLELQDIRWRAAEVLVRRTKARRDRIVPRYVQRKPPADLGRSTLTAASGRLSSTKESDPVSCIGT